MPFRAVAIWWYASVTWKLTRSATDSASAVYELLGSMLRRVPRDMSLTSLSTLSTLDRTGPRRTTD